MLGEVDPNGNITSSRKYDVYGLIRGGNNPGGTSSHKFVGQLGHPSEDNTGLIYMRARYYDPAIGRFTSEDPALSGNNWFVYCMNDPINCTDEDGKQALLNLMTQAFAYFLLFLEMWGSYKKFLKILERARKIWTLVTQQANATMEEGRALISESAGDETGMAFEMGVAMMELAGKAIIGGAIAAIVGMWTALQWVLIWHINNDVNETPGLEP